ncbi:MAG: FtsX-like permease family protein [Acutalibacteraceae bacterium]|nr:FtsX-like permease family protein [Acutalibacteraceae bacterium]
MSFKESFFNALSSIYSNKSRNLLSMFGIVVGISFVIVILSLGSTVQNIVDQLLQGQVGSISTVDAFILDVTNKEMKTFSDISINNFEKQYSNIIFDILTESPEKLTGYFTDSNRSNVKDEKYSYSDVSGVSKGYELYKNISLIKGRFINDSDCSEVKSSVVISDISAKAMFGTTSCIGKTISFNSDDNKKCDFVIVGVYHYIDQSGESLKGYNTVKTTAYISYSFMNKLFGKDVNNTTRNNDTGTTDNYIKIIPVSDDYSVAITLAVTDYFEKIYNDDNYKIYAYPIESEDQTGLKSLPIIITGVFLVIALISLIVGGIGVMNINLINITEKTQEIGVCKALGAKNSNIALQFLLESVIVCVIAGAVGVFVGFGLDIIVENIITNLVSSMPVSMGSTKSLLLTVDLSVTPSIFAIVVSFAITVITGIVFGVIPATKASKMLVVDALRYE